MAQIHALRYEILGYCCGEYWDEAENIFKELSLDVDLDKFDWDESFCCNIADFFSTFLLFTPRKVSSWEYCYACIFPLDSSGRRKIICPGNAYTEDKKQIAQWRYDWTKLLAVRCAQFEKKYGFEVPYIKGQNSIPVYLKQNLTDFQKEMEDVEFCDC